MAKIDLIDTAQLADGQVKIVDLKYDSIAVFKKDERYYAYLDSCPHTDAPMGPGVLDGDRIVCPLHGACFLATTGTVLTPPATSDLEMLNVEEHDGRLYVEYEE